MAHEKLRPQYFFDEEKIKQLRQIAPECFEDGKINFETLRQNLGDLVQDEFDSSMEHFGLFWPGKKEARRAAALPPEGTLEPVYGEGLKADGTPDTDGENDSRNIFIEGENLEVLKILQKSYANKIKMIYIDPPYNTGKDFVYDDDFTEPLQEYLRRTGQVDEEGKPLTTNKRSDGRFHSKWLSMMYPRLRLARNLLREDGVIFVSIDDNEVHNLRAIMNEIFGEENFIGIMKRRAARKSANLSITMSDLCDYVMVFCKEELKFPLSNSNASDTTRPVFNAGNSISERTIKSNTECRCSDGFYEKGQYSVRTINFELVDDLEIKNGSTINKVRIKGPWRINQNVLEKTVYFTSNFGLRRYLLPEEFEKPKAINDLVDNPAFYNENGSEQLAEILKETNVFQNPKPVDLIKYLIEVVECENSNEDFVVLDFFAGSGTTGHAMNTHELNGKSGKYILVQLPEIIDKNNNEQKAAYNFCDKNKLRPFLSEITKERLRRLNPSSGYKVFKLTHSSFKKWKDLNVSNLENLEQQLDIFNNSPLSDNWGKNKLLTETTLVEGFPLDSSFKKFTIGKNEFYHVQSDDLVQELLICLDEKIEETLIEQLDMGSHATFICLDSAIRNKDKLRMSDKGLIKTI
ncbi:MAG: site-specific DNA-methyltransferase [Bacteroidales bacterium]|nr:site-specific DNA-methyltransferase [Bacteroidales bacterium]